MRFYELGLHQGGLEFQFKHTGYAPMESIHEFDCFITYPDKKTSRVKFFAHTRYVRSKSVLKGVVYFNRQGEHFVSSHTLQSLAALIRHIVDEGVVEG